MSGGTVYIVLFRGVGGKTQLPVAPLREKLALAGFENVATYINSGNAVVRSALPRHEVVEKVADVCAREFAFDHLRIRVGISADHVEVRCQLRDDLQLGAARAGLVEREPEVMLEVARHAAVDVRKDVGAGVVQRVVKVEQPDWGGGHRRIQCFGALQRAGVRGWKRMMLRPLSVVFGGAFQAWPWMSSKVAGRRPS